MENSIFRIRQSAALIYVVLAEGGVAQWAMDDSHDQQSEETSDIQYKQIPSRDSCIIQTVDTDKDGEQ